MEKEGLGPVEWIHQSRALSLKSSMKALNGPECLLQERRVVGQKRE